MKNLVADANLYFPMAREGDTGIQQERIGMKMFIFLMHRQHRIFNECLVVRIRKPRKCIRKPSNKQNCVVVVVYAVSDGVAMCFGLVCFFPGPHCFTMLLRTSVVVNHLQGCFQINPLWSPGSAVGKLPCCSRVLGSLNPSASLGQSSLMKSQYLDCTVPRICKHAA